MKFIHRLMKISSGEDISTQVVQRSAVQKKEDLVVTRAGLQRLGVVRTRNPGNIWQVDGKWTRSHKGVK